MSGFGKVEVLVTRPPRLRAPTHQGGSHLGRRPHLVVAAAHKKDGGFDPISADPGLFRG
jgi:hypothetical protein